RLQPPTLFPYTNALPISEARGAWRRPRGSETRPPPCGRGRRAGPFADGRTGSAGTRRTAAAPTVPLQRSGRAPIAASLALRPPRSEEHTSELQSLAYLVC